MTSKKESVSISSDGYVDSTVMASKSIPLEKKETFWFFFCLGLFLFFFLFFFSCVNFISIDRREETFCNPLWVTRVTSWSAIFPGSRIDRWRRTTTPYIFPLLVEPPALYHYLHLFFSSSVVRTLKFTFILSCMALVRQRRLYIRHFCRQPSAQECCLGCFFLFPATTTSSSRCCLMCEGGIS